MPAQPVICERKLILPLIAQPSGMAGSSGNSILRIGQLFAGGQAAPNKLVVLIENRRNASGATKQPFQRPLRLALALSLSALNRPFADRSRFSAQPSCTIH